MKVDGKSTLNGIPFRRRIGYVIQGSRFVPHLSVEENIGVVPPGRLEADRIEARARALLATIGLDPDRFAARFPAELSGGQRQRVGVARALAADPPVMLLDEPFGALDPITRRDIQQEFRTLQERLQKTLVFVTHDVREALLLAHRIGLVKDGKMVLLGPPSDLLQSNDPEARAFAACASDGELPGAPCEPHRVPVTQSPRSRYAHLRASFPGGSLHGHRHSACRSGSCSPESRV